MAPSDWLKTQSYDRIPNNHLLKIHRFDCIMKNPNRWCCNASQAGSNQVCLHSNAMGCHFIHVFVLKGQFELSF